MGYGKESKGIGKRSGRPMADQDSEGRGGKRKLMMLKWDRVLNGCCWKLIELKLLGSTNRSLKVLSS